MPNIVIGIPTYQRPKQLKRLALSIAEILVPANSSIIVLIANNDSDRVSVESVVSDLSTSSFPFDLSHIQVEEKGISFTRNAILAYTFEKCYADVLVMVDDDELVTSRWITELLETQSNVGADIVGGLKTPLFEVEPDPWMPLNDAYFYQPSNRSGQCNRLVSTDNLLITREAYIRLGKPQFDSGFALTGGGDTEFLHRLGKEGAKFAFSLDALTHEVVPKERMTVDWARARAKRIGIGLARIYLLHLTPFQIATQVLKLLTILCASAILYCLFYFSSTKRLKYLTLCDKQIGKVSGFFGVKIYPYMNQ